MYPRYQLSVTPLDWRFASNTGLSTAQIEDHVRKQLLKSLVWGAEGSQKNSSKDSLRKAQINVELDASTRMRKVTYNFTLTVKTPHHWNRAFPKAWQWSQTGQGESKTHTYPRDFLNEMDQVLKNFAKAWNEHLKK